jgi:hypothetical protein
MLIKVYFLKSFAFPLGYLKSVNFDQLLIEVLNEINPRETTRTSFLTKLTANNKIKIKLEL